MSCTIQDIKTKGMDKVKTMFKGDAKGITFTGDTAKVNFGRKFKLKTKEDATKAIKMRATQINKWSSDTFQTSQFTDKWVSMFEDNNNNVYAKIHFPEELEMAFEEKIASEKLDENLLNDTTDSLFKITPKDRVRDELGAISPDADLTTVELRLARAMDQILDVLESQQKIAEKKKTDKDNTEYLLYLEDIKKQVETFKDVSDIKGIVSFTSYMNSQLKSLHSKFDKIAEADEDNLETINQFESYTAAYSLVEQVQKLYLDIKLNNKELSNSDVEMLGEKLENVRGSYILLEEKYLARTRNIMKRTINDPKFHADVIYNVRKDLEKQYKDLYGQQASGIKEWVAKKLNSTDTKLLIEELTEKKVDSILHDIGNDISGITRWLVDDLNTNNKLIQITSNMLSEIRDNIVSKTREINHELGVLFDEYRKGKNTTNLKKLYEKLLDTDSEGNSYLRGEYSAEFLLEKNRRQTLLTEAGEEYSETSQEFISVLMGYHAWFQENTKTIKLVERNEKDEVVSETYKKVPIDKWKNPTQSLTDIEQKVLDKFKELSEDAANRTHNMSSLVKTYGYAKWYKLPSVTKSDMERILSDMRPVGTFVDKWVDLKEMRPDDVGYGRVPTMIDGTEIHFIPIHYRGNLKPEDQSLDLFYLYSLDAKNTIAFQEKQSKELELNALATVAKSKEYFATKGMSKERLLSIFNKNNPTVKKKGKDSHTLAKIEGMIQNQMYDITNKYAGEVKGLNNADLNKLVNTINGLTATIGMGWNWMGGVANTFTGNLNTSLEAIAGNQINGKSLAKAVQFYTSDLPNYVGDIGKPVKRSITNQINEMFDIFGHNNIIGQDFLKSNKFKSIVNSSVLTFMYSAGEHQIQSTLTLAVLDNIKVQNGDNDYINKNGKVTTYAKAASMLDMMMIDKKGRVKINDNVVYTEFTPVTKMNEGGRSHISSFIKKKIFDTQGVYDNRFKSEGQRTWIGSIAFLFRRYLISTAQRRMKGLGTSRRPKELLEEKDRHWNDAIKDYDEGTYTSFVRFITNTAIPAIRKFQFDLITMDWANMSELERGNVKRTMVELILMFGVLPILHSLAAEMGDDDKENEDAWYYLAYQLRRQESELQQFLDINEAWRILQSPAASVRTLTHITRNLKTIIDVSSWNDRYESGKNKDELKAKHYMYDLIPVVTRMDVSPRESYNWIDR